MFHLLDTEREKIFRHEPESSQLLLSSAHIPKGLPTKSGWRGFVELVHTVSTVHKEKILKETQTPNIIVQLLSTCSWFGFGWVLAYVQAITKHFVNRNSTQMYFLYFLFVLQLSLFCTVCTVLHQFVNRLLYFRNIFPCPANIYKFIYFAEMTFW
jgi:hypothetical protein